MKFKNMSADGQEAYIKGICDEVQSDLTDVSAMVIMLVTPVDGVETGIFTNLRVIRHEVPNLPFLIQRSVNELVKKIGGGEHGRSWENN
jgi:hypothetical protein